MASAGPHAKQSAHRCRQKTTPVLRHSIFTGWVLLLTPNRHYESREGKIGPYGVGWCRVSCGRSSGCGARVPRRDAESALSDAGVAAAAQTWRLALRGAFTLTVQRLHRLIGRHVVKYDERLN